MLCLTVKTLDSQNHEFHVEDDITVKEFKEKISPTLSIAADKQRLIFCGKVLKDEKKLNEYGVDGKVIHVVQSLPPQSTSTSSPSTNTTSSTGTRGGPRDAAGFLLGAFTIPQDLIDPTQVQNIVQEVVSGMGEIGRNATVMSRTSDDGSSVDVHINLGQLPMQSEAQLRMNRVQTMLLRAGRLLESLEDGSNGQNNGNSADSSSQTEEAEDLRTIPMDLDVGNQSLVDNGVSNVSGDNTTPAETPQNDRVADTPTSQASDTSDRPPSFSERYRFEGLASAAQAAISAALTTAYAAARAASATVSTPTVTNISTSTTSTDSDSSISIDSEPMDLTAAADSLRLMSSHFLRSSHVINNIPGETNNANSEANAPAPRISTQHNQGNEPTSESTTPVTTERSAAEVPGTDAAPPRRENIQPSVQTLANLLDDVIRLNTRLEPCLERCRDLIRRDAPLTGRQLGDAHRLFSRISQLLHFMSHAYHSLSDLHINFSQTPPRSPRVRIISSAHGSSLIHTGIPLQAQISVTSSVLSPSSSSTTTTANTATPNTAAPEIAQNSNTEAHASTRVQNETPTSAAPSATTAPTPCPLSSMMRNQNPLFFMEVSPTSVSIASSEVSVSGNGNSAAPPLPPRNRETTVPADSDTSSANQNSTNRPSANVNFTAGQGHPLINLPFRNIIPVPLTSMGSLQTFDSGLPCHSVWALEPSRRRHNAGGSRTPAAVQIGLTPNIPGRQEEQLTQVISNIMMSLLNHPNVPTQGTQGTGAVTMLSSGNLPVHDIQRSGRYMFDNSGNLRRLGPMTESNDSTSYLAPDTVPPPELDDEHFLFLVDEHFVASDGLQLVYISEILSDYCVSLIDQRDLGRFGHLLWFLASKLTFSDIVDVYRGNFGPLDRLETPLLNYLRETFFDGGEINEDAYRSIVEEFITSIAPALETVSKRMIRDPSYDFKKIVSTFFVDVGCKIVKMLLAPTADSTDSFGKRLFTACREVFCEFLSVHDRIAGGRATLERVFIENLNRLLLPYDLKQALLLFVSRVIMSTAREGDENATTTQRVPPAQRRNKSSSSAAENNTSNMSSKKETRKKESLPARSRESANRQETAPALAAFARFAERNPVLLRSNASSDSNRSAVNNLAEVVIGSQAWHNTLPRDWVPIIARDVQRQRRQAPQAPFSNAYMSGMPSKRRKIMATGTAPLLGTSQGTLSELLLQAVQNSGARPLTSNEDLRIEASRDSDLQASFQQHLKGTIQERLNRDIDFCSERFPNAEKYFNIERI